MSLVAPSFEEAQGRVCSQAPVKKSIAAVAIESKQELGTNRAGTKKEEFLPKETIYEL
jgi:hypothetical protein